MARRLGQFLIFMGVGPPVGGFVYALWHLTVVLATRGWPMEPGEGLQMAIAGATITIGMMLMVPVLSYFVGFKAALITATLCLFAPRERLSARQWMSVCALIGATVSAALTWKDQSAALAIQIGAAGAAGALTSAWLIERLRVRRLAKT